MFEQLSPLYRKILALALLALAVMIFTGSIVLPLSGMFSGKSIRVEQLYSSVERYQTILAREELYQQRLALIRQSPKPDITYSANSHAALNAQMQNDIRNLIRQSGGHIDNMQSIAPTPEDGFQKIGLRLSLRADSKVLNRILQNVGQHHKLLNFETVSIRTPENQNVNNPPAMTIRWDIYGYGVILTGQGGVQ